MTRVLRHTNEIDVDAAGYAQLSQLAELIADRCGEATVSCIPDVLDVSRNSEGHRFEIRKGGNGSFLIRAAGRHSIKDRGCRGVSPPLRINEDSLRAVRSFLDARTPRVVVEHPSLTDTRPPPPPGPSPRSRAPKHIQQDTRVSAAPQWNVGVVEALWYGNWYPVTILRDEGAEFLVSFTTGEQDLVPKGCVRQGGEASAAPQWNVGDHVEAFWYDDIWYPVTILKDEGQEFCVRFTTGEQSAVPKSCVRPHGNGDAQLDGRRSADNPPLPNSESFEVGDHVEGWWSDTWFPVTIIARIDENTFDVLWEDTNEQSDLNLADLRRPMWEVAHLRKHSDAGTVYDV